MEYGDRVVLTVGLFLIVFTIGIGIIINTVDNSCQSCKTCENAKEYYTKINEFNGVRDTENINGAYYVADDYYCVWTKGRAAEEIANTDEHEKCHALIDNDKKHFCGRFFMYQNISQS